jgi:exosortase
MSQSIGIGNDALGEGHESPTARPARATGTSRWTWRAFGARLLGDRLGIEHVIAAGLMATLGILALLPAWQDIYLIAKGDEEESHIFLVPLVAIYLVWVRRTRLRHCTPSFRAIGPLIVAAGWIISMIGFYRGIQSFWHGGAVLVAIGCALSILGKNVLFRFFPAIAVLVFLVPVPARARLAFSTPLQSWTAQISQKSLQVMGFDAEVAGNTLIVNNKPVTVAEACNGLRMVFALILVSYTFGFGMPLRNSVRLLILLASPLAAIFCNVVRLLPTIWLYGYKSPAIADAFHEYSGWMMLPLAFLMLYGIIGALRWAMVPVTQYTLAAQ